jgi:hypothetical protein
MSQHNNFQQTALININIVFSENTTIRIFMIYKSHLHLDAQIRKEEEEREEKEVGVAFWKLE